MWEVKGKSVYNTSGKSRGGNQKLTKLYNFRAWTVLYCTVLYLNSGATNIFLGPVTRPRQARRTCCGAKPDACGVMDVCLGMSSSNIITGFAIVPRTHSSVALGILALSGHGDVKVERCQRQDSRDRYNKKSRYYALAYPPAPLAPQSPWALGTQRFLNLMFGVPTGMHVMTGRLLRT